MEGVKCKVEDIFLGRREVIKCEVQSAKWEVRSLKVGRGRCKVSS